MSLGAVALALLALSSCSTKGDEVAACGGIGEGAGSACREEEWLERRRDEPLQFPRAAAWILPDDATGYVASHALASLEEDVTIVGVEPVTEPGLKATYLGYTYCEKSCIGWTSWNDDGKAMVERTKVGMFPILAANRGPKREPELIFLLEPTEEGRRILTEDKRCLLFAGVWITLEGGKRFFVDSVGEPLSGINAYGSSAPAGYVSCLARRQLPLEQLGIRSG